MTHPTHLKFEQALCAPAAQVYAAFTSSVALESWFSDVAEIVAEKPGRFYAWWTTGYYTCGRFNNVEERKHLGLHWQGSGDPTTTEVDIYFIEEDDKTLVTVQHSGIGEGEDWESAMAQIKTGWETALANLKSVLETGLDKRVFDRPLLGIIPGAEVDEKLAEKLGAPVARGIQLAGVLAGMSAEAAGLRENDVLITLNDRPLMTFRDFAPALAGKKAGDVVKVEYYRGSELHTINMGLARRPVPEQPQTAAMLADQVAAEYTKVAEEREALFVGANEAQASARPAPEEWSAKETLVHLLYTERWLHLALSCIVGEQRTGGFVNQLELIAAMASAYTLEELLHELKRSEAVTVASLRALPESFVTDKRKFIGFVNTIGQGFAQHTRNHFDQIRQALAAAQGA